MLTATLQSAAAHAAGVVLGAPSGDKDERNPLALDMGGEGLSPFERATEDLLFLVVDIGILTTVLGLLLCCARLLKGPNLLDRAIASDTIALQVVGLVVLLAVRFSTIVDFDVVLVVSFLGFIATVAFAQFIGRRGSAV